MPCTPPNQSVKKVPSETAINAPSSDQPVHTSHRGHLRRVFALAEVALVELLVELLVAGLLELAVVASLIVNILACAAARQLACSAASDFALAGCRHRG